MFGFHPANLAFRFALEIAALIAIAFGAYSLASGPFAWAIAVALPLVAAVAWGTFNVPGDRSRSGAAPVPVPGVVRLLIELDVFLAAVFLLWFAAPVASIVLACCVVLHYALSIDRIRWLLSQNSSEVQTAEEEA
ncbi:MAG: YrdB family protein [Acidimicrobiia bacterium]